MRRLSAGQLPQEFLFIHAVLESLAAVDENDRNFVVILPAQFVVRINVDFLPRKSASPREFGKALFDHLAQMTSLARVDDNAPGFLHAGILTRKCENFPHFSADQAPGSPVRHPAANRK